MEQGKDQGLGVSWCLWLLTFLVTNCLVPKQLSPLDKQGYNCGHRRCSGGFEGPLRLSLCLSQVLSLWSWGSEGTSLPLLLSIVWAGAGVSLAGRLLDHGDLTKTISPAWAVGSPGKLKGGFGKVPRVGSACMTSTRQLLP